MKTESVSLLTTARDPEIEYEVQVPERFVDGASVYEAAKNMNDKGRKAGAKLPMKHATNKVGSTHQFRGFQLQNCRRD